MSIDNATFEEWKDAAKQERERMAMQRASWGMAVEPGQTHIGTARIREVVAYAPGQFEDEITRELLAQRAASLAPEKMEPVPAKKAKKSKYRNIECEADGIKFDSMKERRRYIYLRDKQARGLIRDLRMQVRYQIAESCTVEGEKLRARFYVADFVYRDMEREAVVVEDVKGMRTDMYRFKRQMMKLVHGIEVTEI
ncbi:DUF1064 domain-containing protein [Paraburkholderia sp. BR10936]|uniref:DUF1064 domain-containing protein n=1 Tax=Paraburkholderia sp. BR10936 TaxID=3236993 RepID=UPI0034D333DF